MEFEAEVVCPKCKQNAKATEEYVSGTMSSHMVKQALRHCGQSFTRTVEYGAPSSLTTPFGFTQEMIDAEREQSAHEHDLATIPCCLCGRLTCGTTEPVCVSGTVRLVA